MDVWKLVENGYQVPKSTQIDAIDKRLYENNAMARNAILCVLVDYEFTKVMECT